MDLNCNPEVAAHLNKSASQKVRLISEDCFGRFGYCLRCSSNRLAPTRANTVCQDFACPLCGQPYELKSASRAHTRSVQDGGYESMMECIRSGNAPALMLLHYSPDWYVRGLIAIHPAFLTPTGVVKRNKPLLRPEPYWMCSLNLSFIPSDGKIVLVSDGKALPRVDVRLKYLESVQIGKLPLKERGWASLVLAAVRRIGKQHITNADLYAQEKILHAAYPNNRHVRPKIRQQMQELERLGYVHRTSRGEYQVIR